MTPGYAHCRSAAGLANGESVDGGFDEYGKFYPDCRRN
jgi:hypothetical protein